MALNPARLCVQGLAASLVKIGLSKRLFANLEHLDRLGFFEVVIAGSVSHKQGIGSLFLSSQTIHWSISGNTAYSSCTSCFCGPAPQGLFMQTTGHDWQVHERSCLCQHDRKTLSVCQLKLSALFLVRSVIGPSTGLVSQK
jgi:hypothetical protein